jgi:hypothetical protein
MTATPSTRQPVPFADRQEFQARIRAVATAQQATVNEVCAAARTVSTDFGWATARDVANELVNVLGTGWGAIFLHWFHEQPKER